MNNYYSSPQKTPKSIFPTNRTMNRNLNQTFLLLVGGLVILNGDADSTLRVIVDILNGLIPN